MSLLALGQDKEDGPYFLSLERDVAFVGGAAGAMLWSKGQSRKVPDVLLSDLDLGTVPFFDRIPDGFRSKRARLWSDQTRDFSKALPLLLLFNKTSRQDAGKLAILFAESYYLTKGLTDVTKAIARRPRPYVRDDLGIEGTVIEPGDRASFWSGHTSGAAAGGFFFGRVFSDYYPESKLKPYVWVVSAGLPALTGYLRVRAGQHYPSDVIVGYAVGAIIGYGVPALHRRPLREKRLRLSSGLNGVSLSFRLE